MRTSNEIRRIVHSTPLAVTGSVTKEANFTWLNIRLGIPKFSGLNRALRAILAGVVVFGLILPVLEAAMLHQRYRLAAETSQLLGEGPGEHIRQKLVFDRASKTYKFNSDALATSSEQPNLKTTSGNYYSEIHADPAEGIKITDPASKLSLAAKPLFPLLEGKETDGHIVFPVTALPSQLIYTIKGNGLKEDIVMRRYSGDKMDFAYRIDISSELEMRLGDGGSVGFYSSDPTLFGDISYGSDEDRLKVEEARRNGKKDFLVFAVPSPVIKDAKGNYHRDKARYRLEGQQLVLETYNLKGLSYPIAIDPSFVVTSASDFGQGNNEENIEFDVAGGSIRRQEVSGGALGNTFWSTTTNIGTARHDHTVTVNNGYIYVAGGCTSRTTPHCGSRLDSVIYGQIQSDGSVPSWGSATALPVARSGHSAAVYNNRLYILGGQDAPTSSTTSVLVANIQKDGSLGSWTNLGNYNTADQGRHWLSATAYKGYLYVSGGWHTTGSANFSDEVKYAKINPDGTLGSWNSTTSLPGKRFGHNIAAYNGRMYVVAGCITKNDALLAGTCSDATNTVQFAAINEDGTLGSSWYSAGNLRVSDHHTGSLVIARGHMYYVGGCAAGDHCTEITNGTQWAPIYADGTVGTFNFTTAIGGARYMMGAGYWNGRLFYVGGCDSAAANTVCNSSINEARHITIAARGGAESFSATTAISPGRWRHSGVAYNGFLYISGGCTTTACTDSEAGGGYSNDVFYAPLNADGGLGSWTATSSMIATGTDLSGRVGHTMEAYNGYLYIIGGIARNTLNTGDVYKADVIFAKLSTDGGIVANGVCTPAANWCQTGTSGMPARRHSAIEAYNNFIYMYGGRNSGDTADNYGYYAPLAANGTVGAWTMVSNTVWPLSTLREGATLTAYNGHLYVAGGAASSGAHDNVDIIKINNDGSLSSSGHTEVILPEKRYGHVSGIYDGYWYIFGGKTCTTTGCSGTNPTNSMIVSKINSDGSMGAWTTSASMVTARSGAVGGVFNGHAYAIGGCSESGSSGLATCSNALNILTSSETSTLQIGGSGMAEINAGTSALATGRAYSVTAVHNGYIYVFGGQNEGSDHGTTTVQYAPINGDGSLGTWIINTGRELPDKHFIGTGEVYNGYIYVIGGNWRELANAQFVYRAKFNTVGGGLQADAGCGSVWCQEPSISNPGGGGNGRMYLSSVRFKDYIYVFGGRNRFDGASQDSYDYTRVNSDGTLQTWTLVSGIGGPREGMGAVVYNQHIYLIGGINLNTDPDTYLNEVLYTKINLAANGTQTLAVPTGCTAVSGVWCRTTGLPESRVYLGANAENGYVYAVGGYTSDEEKSILGAPILSDGRIGQWESVGRMANRRALSAKGAHISAGKLYIPGGDGDVAVSNGPNNVVTVEERATLRSPARFSRYSRLLDADLDVAAAKMVFNGTKLSENASLGLKYRTACVTDGTTLGPEDQASSVTLNSALSFIANNGCNNSSTGLFRYFSLVLDIDDSQTATIHDESSSSISNIQVFYRPNPGRRLRGGKTFTGGAQQGLDAAP